MSRNSEAVIRFKKRQRCIAAGEPIPEWAALRPRGRPPAPPDKQGIKNNKSRYYYRKKCIRLGIPVPEWAQLLPRNTREYPPIPRPIGKRGRPTTFTKEERLEHRHTYWKKWYAALRADPVRWKERCDKMNAQEKARKERKRKRKTAK